jgi:hypothetical protein
MVCDSSISSTLNHSDTTTSYEQFRDIANITDLDMPYQTAGISFSETATRSTAKRLRRTRQHLGSYRHDLLVAMRVVNNVEREMMRAEWENWLLDENARCKQVQVLLRENRTSASPNKKTKGTDSQKVFDAKERERREKLDDLRSWQEEYCGSCKMEQEMLSKGRKHLAFG